jgi:iron complex transport system substrate-binding protein
VRRLRGYPDSRIVAVCPCLPHVSGFGRLPAYSGATVPAFDRLPARKRERAGLPRAGERSLFLETLDRMKSVFGLLVVLALCACASNRVPQARANGVQAAQRIVSLMPSFTEDLCAIGAGGQIVGVSDFTDDIPCAHGVARVGNFSSIDTERILELHPDLVVAIPAQRALTESLRRAGVRTELVKDDSYTDLFDDIAALGAMSGHAAQARELSASLRKHTQALRSSEHFTRQPTVFFVVQALPIWTVGPQSYISTLIELAGARNAVSSLPTAYAQFSPEALIRLQPDAIVATNDARLDALLSREPWRSLRAVREGHVFVLKDPSILARPGPRYNQGVAWLIDRLRPLATQ